MDAVESPRPSSVHVRQSQLMPHDGRRRPRRVEVPSPPARWRNETPAPRWPRWNGQPQATFVCAVVTSPRHQASDRPRSALVSLEQNVFSIWPRVPLPAPPAPSWRASRDAPAQVPCCQVLGRHLGDPLPAAAAPAADPAVD